MAVYALEPPTGTSNTSTGLRPRFTSENPEFGTPVGPRIQLEPDSLLRDRRRLIQMTRTIGAKGTTPFFSHISQSYIPPFGGM